MDLTLDNDDLLMRILLLLPAKSLIKYKSVCKKWLSLISSDHFCHQHTLRRPKLPQSLILQKYINQPLFYSGQKVVVPYSLSGPSRYILQGCNGLLLLNSCELQGGDYYVLNPTTKRSRKIISPMSAKYPYVAGMGLAFDPSQSPYYKIVCFRSTSHQFPFLPFLIPCQLPSASYTYQIEVYDSESHTWKLSLEPVISDDIFYLSGMTYCNNSIYWRNDIRSCYCFDIAKNEMKYLTCPWSRYPDSSAHYFQESNGHLYLFELSTMSEILSVAVWELGGDDPSQWLLKYDHNIPYYPIHINMPVRFIRGSESDSLLIYELRKLRAYNFLDKSYEEIAHIPFARNMCDVRGFQFGEILALV